MSRPTRARGLKRDTTANRASPQGVAPHAGAWIETTPPHPRSVIHWSRPTRARGLKLYPILGLNRSFFVAPHAGAWIETTFSAPNNVHSRVAPHAGASKHKKTVICFQVGCRLCATQYQCLNLTLPRNPRQQGPGEPQHKKEAGHVGDRRQDGPRSQGGIHAHPAEHQGQDSAQAYR